MHRPDNGITPTVAREWLCCRLSWTDRPVVLHLTVLQLGVRRMVSQLAVPLVLVPRTVNLRLSPGVGVCVTLSVALHDRLVCFVEVVRMEPTPETMYKLLFMEHNHAASKYTDNAHMC